MTHDTRQQVLPGALPEPEWAYLSMARAELAATPEAQARTLTNLTGRFYTHASIAEHMNAVLQRLLAPLGSSTEPITLCDPFAGDGRLIHWFLVSNADFARSRKWAIELWDIDEHGLSGCEEALEKVAAEHGIEARIRTHVVDSFSYALDRGQHFRLVLTNPPWENLKPDRRELASLGEEARSEYIRSLKETDRFLESRFPYSQPSRKYAGWGTNLARVGVELVVNILEEGGLAAIVVPASLLADDISQPLRRWLIEQATLNDVAFFPAEARAFGRADVASATVVLTKEPPSSALAPLVTIYDKDFSKQEESILRVTQSFLDSSGSVVPIGFGIPAARLAVGLQRLPTFGSLEADATAGLWAGRELDETRVNESLNESEQPDFFKGKMVERFTIRERPSHRVEKVGWAKPASCNFERLVWRDVSRSNQKRRVQATIIPKSWVCGNSLGVAHFRDGDPRRLRWLLGVMSSVVFEAQLRAFLATGHVTLSALRKVRIPQYDEADPIVDELDRTMRDALAGSRTAPWRAEAIVARLYGLSDSELGTILDQFPKLPDAEKRHILEQTQVT